MKIAGIRASIRVAKRDHVAEKKVHLQNNLLYTEGIGHDFYPEKSNIYWSTDCSEIAFGIDHHQKIRVSAIKDLHDKSIIAWRVAPTETAELVTKTVEDALANNGDVFPKVLHTDQGSAYTAFQYDTCLASHGILHSLSRPGTPGDNSPMESLWSLLKTEWFAFGNPMSKVAMIKSIEDAINWYNNERRQESLNGMTPAEFRNHNTKKIA